MHLGIFGGSFDPVHNGHLALAHACQQQARLDEVWFMPTAIQPLKQHGPRASSLDRAAMLRAALAERELALGGGDAPARWRVCTLEIDRGGRSYTVDTLRQMREELPDAKLYFLIGSDALGDVLHWKEPDVIFALSTPLVVHRAGEPAADLAAVAKLCTPETMPQLVEMPATDISSTEIRRRVAQGESISSLVPPSVDAYIREFGLYR